MPPEFAPPARSKKAARPAVEHQPATSAPPPPRRCIVRRHPRRHLWTQCCEDDAHRYENRGDPCNHFDAVRAGKPHVRPRWTGYVRSELVQQPQRSAALRMAAAMIQWRRDRDTVAKRPGKFFSSRVNDAESVVRAPPLA